MDNQELEVKFYIADLSQVEQRLIALGAILVQPRTFEINLRFDTPEMTLAQRYQVLRLRQDTAARMTFKGPASAVKGVRLRKEIEFVVEDFETARAFLEALGYRVSMIYEKYRSVYDLGQVHITLDELPYGAFVEVEGPDPAGIYTVSQDLQLSWQARLPASYTALFERLRQEQHLDFRDLSFENFAGLKITSEQLHVTPADALDG